MATTKITSPDLFELESLNTALRLPSGSTQQRPANPSTGEWRYNTTTNLVEYYDGGSWRELVSEDIPPIPSENFNTVLYSGNSSTQSITGVGFQPDFVWIKRRDGTENHYWQDSSRGSTQQIYSNLLDVQYNETTAVTSFDADGFTMGSYNGINNTGETYVAWCFKANGGTTSTNTEGTITSTVQANTQAGFSIVQWTGTGSSGTIGHGLNSAPEMLILKDTTVAYNWYVFTTATGSNIRFEGLNNANLSTSAPSQMTSTASLIENVPALSSLNTSGSNMIIYAFHSVAGYSKIGSYTGNGSDDGPIINTGFEPAWLMIKVSTGSADGWFMVDNKRSTSNPRGLRVFANSNVGDASESGAQVDFFTNGFQLRGTGSGQGQTNGSGNQYIYIAFASDPSTAPVLASSFTTNTYAGTGSARSISGLGLAPSLTWIKNRTSAASHSWTDSVRGNNLVLQSNETSAEATGQITLDTDGFTIGNNNLLRNASGNDYVAWNWKANTLTTINTDGSVTSIVSSNQASGFSIVKWDGTGGASTIGHGLGIAPQLVIVKGIDSVSDWQVYSEITGETKKLILNSNIAESSSTRFDNTTPTTSVFSFNNSGLGTSQIAFCFHSVSGFSKIGSYTGNSSSTNAITGLGFQPNFVIIKPTTFAESWSVFDSLRGANKRLVPNGNDQEYTNSGGGYLASFDSDGFTTQEGASNDYNVNKQGETYLYMAFKENIAEPALPAGEAEFLVVAGGGGAGGGCGARGGGGAGAGGLRTSFGSTSGGGSSAESNITLASGTYTITIGTGGSSGSNCNAGGTGNDSSITGPVTITSDGGGYSGSGTLGAGGAGGSGGSGYDGGGAATANQGYPGIRSLFGSTYWAGGGGGAASQGNTVQNNGSGGAGLEVNGTFYAGGGGTGQSSGYGSGDGGTGGGGDGQNLNFYTTPCDGDVNTGGGAGGGTYTSSGVPGTTRGGQGGSGVVILQMRASDYSGNTTGSPTVSAAGGLITLTYTGSGTYVHS